MIKTLKVKVFLEVRADIDDDDAVREEVKDMLAEAVELDTLDYTVEESDEDEF